MSPKKVEDLLKTFVEAAQAIFDYEPDAYVKLNNAMHEYQLAYRLGEQPVDEEDK